MRSIKTILAMCVGTVLLLVSAHTNATGSGQHVQAAVYEIKNVKIGPLPVKTIVPITARTRQQALAQAQAIAENQNADLAEWRIDFLDFASDSAQVTALGHELNEILRSKPLIATIRTAKDGGELSLTDQEYEDFYTEYLSEPFMQLVDVEMFRNSRCVQKLIALAHEKNVLVVMSSHDFQKTPPEQEIVDRLLRQDRLGADILKIAVMPRSEFDVLLLMNATLRASQKSQKPLLAISMGQLGTISRVAAANMGASLSFGMIGRASAPGQIDVTELKRFLNTIQPNL